MAVQRLFKSQEWDCDLKVASSCHQALEFLNQGSYDIVLLDYNLSDGTGLELLSQIHNIPVIFISGSSTESVIIQAMKAGAYDFLIKDHNHNYLSLIQPTIEKVLKRKYNSEKNRSE